MRDKVRLLRSLVFSLIVFVFLLSPMKSVAEDKMVTPSGEFIFRLLDGCRRKDMRTVPRSGKNYQQI